MTLRSISCSVSNTIMLTNSGEPQPCSQNAELCSECCTEADREREKERYRESEITTTRDKVTHTMQPSDEHGGMLRFSAAGAELNFKI